MDILIPRYLAPNRHLADGLIPPSPPAERREERRRVIERELRYPISGRVLLPGMPSYNETMQAAGLVNGGMVNEGHALVDGGVIRAHNAFPPGAVVYDTFTDVPGTLLSAHIGEVGASWTRGAVGTGTMGISGDGASLRNISVGSGFYRLYIASGTPSVTATITTNLLYAGSVTDYAFFVGARIQSTASNTNGLWVGYDSTIASWVYFYNTLGSAPSVTSAATLTAGHTYNCVITTANDGSGHAVVTLTVDGVLKINSTQTVSWTTAALGFGVAEYDAADTDTKGIHMLDLLVQ